MMNVIDSIGPGTQLVTIVLGIATLTLGRKLFWLFVGVVGFAVALSITAPLFEGRPGWVALVIALIVGVFGALVAVFIQKIAVAMAGFLVGAYLLVWLGTGLELGPGGWNWVLALAGGILGVVFSTMLFEMALILLSSITGAGLVVTTFNLRPVVTALLFVGLVVAGVIVQVKNWKNE